MVHQMLQDCSWLPSLHCQVLAVVVGLQIDVESTEMQQAQYVFINLSVRACRGSLEVGDVLSDLSANPMEVFILGIHGKLITAPVSSVGFHTESL